MYIVIVSPDTGGGHVAAVGRYTVGRKYGKESDHATSALILDAGANNDLDLQEISKPSISSNLTDGFSDDGGDLMGELYNKYRRLQEQGSS